MKPSPSGSKISALRNQKGMTQQELASLCNVDIRTIQRIESGEVIPRMHTLKLLASALNSDISDLMTSAEPEIKQSNHSLRLPIIVGIIFSLNYLPVVYNIITKSFHPYVNIFFIAIHCVSCILYFKGFYLLGKMRRNQIMEISALLAMILLPLLNVADQLKNIYFPWMTYMIYTLLCVNAIASGVASLMEAGKEQIRYRSNVYKVFGIITLVQSAMFLSSELNIVYTALVISIFTNLVGLTILRFEQKDSGRSAVNETGQVFA